MAHLLAGEGFSKDVIAAIASVSVDHVPNVWNRVRALEKLKKAPDFEPLAVAFKRVVNIIKQAGQSGTVAAGDTEKRVDESLFQDECERALFRAHQDVKNKVANRLDQGDFDQALLDIASLRDSVDAFFDGVMVMTDDVRIRENRLALLKHIAALFGKFADFSKIST
jgi:glycyl-tRNA synthetase beta chain